MCSPVFNWLFYGHFWIALAATALSWQSTYLNGGEVSLGAPHYFVFFATLGVYTLHRLLSYRRAGSHPTGRRYRVVAREPAASVLIGVGSIVVALAIATQLPLRAFWPVLIALPFTGFYLIPLYPGGPRLRDLAYLKVVWVALAWTLITDCFPIMGSGHDYVEGAIRAAFVLAIALLFDTRDVVLDRRQGVRTLAGNHPKLNANVALALLVGCAVVSLWHYPLPQGGVLALAYLAGATIGWITDARQGEDFYATWVNGALLLPPFGLWLFL
ncbi:hypothetical protein GGR28_001217 [Lewinella aquimaris]|uniref:Prenyltransferase n=1 Tax=Neolewinella aquimaris TaxID=1835722 RepID=A0A840DZA4_9BACT|nr:hypothetical protein [Neolewinella aquimaris]MBB4078604.1 hypothetical protein [Neolewinella aquimaris]